MSQEQSPATQIEILRRYAAGQLGTRQTIELAGLAFGGSRAKPRHWF